MSKRERERLALNESARKNYTEKEWQDLVLKRQNLEICGNLTAEGTVCKNPPVMNGRCEKHCGRQGNFLTTDKHEQMLKKVLPDDVLAIYSNYKEAGYEDSSLDLELKILSAKIIDFLKNFQESVSKKEFSTAHSMWQNLRSELSRRPLDDKVRSIIDRFDSVFDSAYNASLHWENLLSTVEQKRRIVETDARKEHYKGNYLHINEVMMIFSALANIVQEEVITRMREFTIDETTGNKLIHDISTRFNRAVSGRK